MEGEVGPDGPIGPIGLVGGVGPVTDGAESDPVGGVVAPSPPQADMAVRLITTRKMMETVLW